MGPVLALILFVLGAVIGVLGGWLRPPAKLRNRGAWLLFAGVLVAASALVYITSGPGRPDATAAKPGAAAGHPASGDPVDQVRTTSSGREPSGGASPAGQDAPATAKPAATKNAATGNAATPVAPPPTSPYLSASKFVKVGGSQGAFTMQAIGSRLDIAVPNQAVSSQWGAELPGRFACATTVEFDVRVEPGTVDLDGFAVLARGRVTNDGADGWGVAFYQDGGQGAGFLAETTLLPADRPAGGVGGGAYPIPDLRTMRHVVVGVSDDGQTLSIDDVSQAELNPAEHECGVVMFVAWGGATVHLDHIQVH